MWKRSIIIIGVLCCLFHYAQAMQRIFVNGADPNTITAVVRQGYLEILNHKLGRGVDCIADDDAIKAIKQSAYQIDIIIPDVEAYYKQKLKASKYDFGQYYTYAEMVKEINSIHDNYPTITSPPEAIGQTGEGRTIWAIRIAKRYGDNDLPSVLYTGVHHAREPIGCTICIGLLKYFCQNYGKDSLATWLINNRNIWLVPVVNPDGYVYNETDPGGFWRKNRRNNGGGIYGVDLNRNYPYKWGYNNTGSSPDSSADDYRGPEPGSEPETEAIMNLAIRESSFKTSINYHSPGNNFGVAWSYDAIVNPDSILFDDLSREITSLNGYYMQTNGPNGDVRDWFYGEQAQKPKCFAYLFEVGGDFWQAVSDSDLIVQQFGQNLPAALAIAQAAGPFVSLSDKAVIAGGNGNDSLEPGETVSLQLTVKNRSLETSITNVKAILTSDDPYLEILQPVAEYGAFAPRQAKSSASQPFIIHCDSVCPNGHRAIYFVNYAADRGYASRDTFSMEIGIFPEDTSFIDDVEQGISGWSHSGTNDLWHITGSDNHSPGNSWYSGLEGFAQYSDNMNCRLVTGPVNSLGFNKIEFWHRYDLEPGYDFGYTEITTDGGIHWQQTGSAYTGKSGWSRQSVDLSKYTGTVRIAFRMFSDISVHDYEGWYIDDILVTGANDTNKAPTRPVAMVPNTDTVDVARPLLRVTKCTDPNGNKIHYGFKVYSDSLLCDIIASTDSSETDTVWQVSTSLPQGRFWWRAYADDGNLRSLFSPPRTFYNTNGITPVIPKVPRYYKLNRCYPNPAGKRVAIPYQLPQKGPLEIKIYNVTGQLIRRLFTGVQGPGNYSVNWDLNDEQGKPVLTGIYICQLSSLGYLGCQKITVISDK